MEERRAHPRKLVSTAVAFHDATAVDAPPLRGWLHDIGRGGCFIATPSRLTFGEVIAFELRLAQAHALVTGKGRVVWTRETNDRDLPAGMGIAFTEISETALAAIDKLGTGARLSRPNTVIGIAPPPATSSPSYSPDVKPLLATKDAPAKVEAPKKKKRRRGLWLLVLGVVTTGGGIAGMVLVFAHHTPVVVVDAAPDVASDVPLDVPLDAPSDAPVDASLDAPRFDASLASASRDASIADASADARARDAGADGGKRKPKPKPRGH